MGIQHQSVCLVYFLCIRTYYSYDFGSLSESYWNHKRNNTFLNEQLNLESCKEFPNTGFHHKKQQTAKKFSADYKD